VKVTGAEVEEDGDEEIEAEVEERSVGPDAVSTRSRSAQKRRRGEEE
jgi:hypothetical protein